MADKDYLDGLVSYLLENGEERSTRNFGSDDVGHANPETGHHETQVNSFLENDRSFSASSFSREPRVAASLPTPPSISGYEYSFDIPTSDPLAGAQQSIFEAAEENPVNSFLAPLETARVDFCRTDDTQANPSEHSSFQNNIGWSKWGQLPQRSLGAYDSNCRKRENNPEEFFPRRKLAHSDLEWSPQISIERGRNEATAPTEEENREFSSSYALCSQSDCISSIEMTTEIASLSSIAGAEAVSAGGPSRIQTWSRQTVKETLKCDVYSKTFGRKRHLDNHSITHTGNKPFVCSTCGRRFATQSNLTRHLRVHTGEKNFACEECGKRFVRKDYLTTHLRTHTGEKNFACEECGRRFARKDYLSTHFRTHTEDKNFACEECGRRFARKDYLTKHLQTHTEEKNFACEECGRRFALKYHLTTHLQTHTEEKPFQCEFCDKKYADKHRRDNHQKERHGKRKQ